MTPMEPLEKVLAQLPHEVHGPLIAAEDQLAQGSYEEGIRALQQLARSNDLPVLMQRLIEHRAAHLARDMQPVDLQPMFVANELLADEQALRARFADDGYLLLRDVLPADALVELRDEITRILAQEGWIEDGERRIEAVAQGRPRREGQAEYFAVQDRIVRLESFHTLAHDPQLLGLMRKLLGATAFPHPLSIVRMIFPHSGELSTPPHQDYPNNQGTSELTAAWMPLADCSIEDGSLAILQGSHRYGLLPLQFHLGAGNRGAVLDERLSALQWVGSDFKLGDVVLFGALTVHRAMENQHPERMRLSVDYRYQREGEALTAGCLQPHFQRLSWEEIYRDWQSDELKYYWRDKRYIEVPWNPSYHELSAEHLDTAYEMELAFNRLFDSRQPG